MHHPLRRARIVAVAALLVFGPAIYVAPAFDTRVACERGWDWATAQASGLPATLEEIRAFPAPFRRAIYGALPAETKVALWKDQLERFASARSLSAEQRAVMDRIIALVTPALYADTVTPAVEATRAAMTELGPEAKRVFGAEDYKAFLELGYDGVRPQHSFASVRLTITESLRNIGSASARQPECECSTQNETEMCSPGQYCEELVICFHTWCGFMVFVPCYGQCRFP